MAFREKLHRYRPDRPPVCLEAVRTKAAGRREEADAASIERGVRQRLADKVSGNRMGLWLLVAEHLRLGTWDLLCGWTGRPAAEVEPRLALQVVHEAALCVTGIRERRCLSQSGFELVNGLPFVASDVAVHRLLDAHTTQPVCLTSATAARTVSQATPALLGLAADILGPAPGRQAPLVVADSEHFTAEFLAGLEGDIRVCDDTIVVTYYNAPHAERLRASVEHLPARLSRERTDPRIPWLYGLKLDFRFR